MDLPETRRSAPQRRPPPWRRPDGPALRVAELKPFTVHGYRFDPESTCTSSRQKHRDERKLDASNRGAFTTVFRHLSVPRCGQYSVRAYGPSGLLDEIKSPPQNCGTPPAP